MPLDPSRVQALFCAAVQHHDPEARAAILDRECPADPDVRERVEALLNAHDRASGFLKEPLIIVDRAVSPTQDDGENPSSCRCAK